MNKHMGSSRTDLRIQPGTERAQAVGDMKYRPNCPTEEWQLP
jgi:hypothetical protein